MGSSGPRTEGGGWIRATGTPPPTSEGGSRYPDLPPATHSLLALSCRPVASGGFKPFLFFESSAWSFPVAAASVSPPTMVSVCLEPRAQVRPVCVNALLLWGFVCGLSMRVHTHTRAWLGSRPTTKCSRSGGEAPTAGAGPKAAPPAAPRGAYLARPATAPPSIRARPIL